MTNTNYQSNNYTTYIYVAVAIFMWLIFTYAYWWGWETNDPYGECISKYTSDVASIKAERESMVSACTKIYPSDVKWLTACIANPKPYPKMECDNISNWTHSTGSTVLPPKWIIQTTHAGESDTKIAHTAEKKVVVQTVQSGTWYSSYWDTYEKSIKLIQKYEGIRLKAYHDYAWCSIWWGTRAKSCKERITQAEADRRLWEIVKKLTTTVSNDFPNLTASQQSALVSFSFNCHRGYVDVKKNWLKYHSRWCKTVTVNGKTKVLKWLEKRREEESKLLFN